MSTVAFDFLSVEGRLPDSRFTVRLNETAGGLKDSTSTPDSLFDDRSTVLKVGKVCRDIGMSPSSIVR